MHDSDKTKEQLIDELGELRRRTAELEGIKIQTEAETLKRLVLEAPIGFFIIQNGRFKLVNPEFREITGYSQDELLGRDSLSLVAPELREMVRGNTIQMLKGKTSIPFEFKFFPKSGEAKWCMQKVISIQYEENRAILGYFMDITEKKQAEEALYRAYEELEVRIQERTAELMEANRTLDAVIQASPEAILAIDPEGKVQLWNPAAERVFGWQKEEVIGQPNPIVSPENQEEFRVLRERELRGEAFHGLEIQRCKKDGSPIDLSLSSAPIRDAEGQISGIMGILSDITQRKRLEQDLARSKTLFEAIFNSITDAAIFVDTNRRILMVNTAAEAMFGYSPGEMNDRNTEFLYADKADYEEQGRIRYHVEAEANLPPFESKYRRKDGTLFPAETTGTIVRDPQGNVLGFIGIKRDISERKLAEEERERLIGELRQALAQVKALKGLLPICAHCKKIRDDQGYWNNVEKYIRDRAEVEFSHGICPGCLKKHYPFFNE